MGTYFEKPIQYQIERIMRRQAGDASAASQTLSPVIAFQATGETTAQAVGDYQQLSGSEIIATSVKIVRTSDGSPYDAGEDYFADANGFTNLTIPAGTQITAEYMEKPTSPAAPRLYDEDNPLPFHSKLKIVGPSVTAYEDPEDDANIIEVDPGTLSPPEPWQELELENSWTATGSGWALPSFYKDRERVYLRGRITDGTTTAATTITTLPAGYAPTAKESPIVMTDSGPITLEIDASGAVKIGDGTAGSDYISLDNVSFRATSTYGARYPDTTRYPNTDRYPNG